MKILILSDDFPPKSYGGAGIVASVQAEELKRRGHEVVVFSVYDDKDKINPRFRSYLSLYNIKTIKKIKSILNDFKPDIVHAHNIHEHISYASLYYAKKSGARVFITLHDAMSVYYGKVPQSHVNSDKPISLIETFKTFGFRVNPFRNIIIKFLFKKLDKIFVVSESLARFLSNNGINNTVVMHNGINTDKWRVPDIVRNEYKKSLGLDSDTKVVMIAGRLNNMKGARVSLKMFSEVLKKYRNVILLIVGKKPEQNNEFDFLIKQLNISDKVVFTGWVRYENMPTIYSISDIVIVPSLYLDPFPTINLEAMASKKPVIGTKFGGTPEIIRNGNNGYIVDPNNIEIFKNKVLDLLTDEQLSINMGKRGYEIVNDEFSLDKKIDYLISCYNH